MRWQGGSEYHPVDRGMQEPCELPHHRRVSNSRTARHSVCDFRTRHRSLLCHRQRAVVLVAALAWLRALEGSPPGKGDRAV